MKTVMVVDDTESVRLTVDIILSDEYNVIQAENVKKMFSLLKESTPDIILLDIMMPDGNGVVVKTRLKSMPEYRHIPIVFLTAVEDGATQKIARIQSEKYIKKPFTEEEILETIKTVFQEKKA